MSCKSPRRPRLALDGDLGPAVAVQVLGFELGQDLLGPLVHGPRHAGQPGDVNAVALVGRAGHDLVQEHDVVLPLLHGHVQVPHARQRLGQVGQLVVVRGKQRAAADLVVQVLDDRPGQRNAVVGARAAADLVEHRPGSAAWPC